MHANQHVVHIEKYVGERRSVDMGVARGGQAEGLVIGLLHCSSKLLN